MGDLDGGGVSKFTGLLGAGVGGFVVGKGVGEIVLSPGHGGHTDEFGEGEGGGVETTGTSGQSGSVPHEGAPVGCLKLPDGEGVSSPVINGNGTTGASVRAGMEEQIVGEGDCVEVTSMPSFLLPDVGAGGQVHAVGLRVTSVPSPRLEDGTHLSMLGLGLLVLHAVFDIVIRKRILDIMIDVYKYKGIPHLQY